MTKTYALVRLLEHGPMTSSEILACTRWPRGTMSKAIAVCIAQGVVERTCLHCWTQWRLGYTYRLKGG